MGGLQPSHDLVFVRGDSPVAFGLTRTNPQGSGGRLETYMAASLRPTLSRHRAYVVFPKYVLPRRTPLRPDNLAAQG